MQRPYAVESAMCDFGIDFDEIEGDEEAIDALAVEFVNYGADFLWDEMEQEHIDWFDHHGLGSRVPDWVREQLVEMETDYYDSYSSEFS